MVETKRYGPTDGSFYEEKVLELMKINLLHINSICFKVLEIKKDPNRTPYIALVAGAKTKRWILATENMKVGQIIRTSSYIPKIPGQLLTVLTANEYCDD